MNEGEFIGLFFLTVLLIYAAIVYVECDHTYGHFGTTWENYWRMFYLILRTVFR